MLIEWDWSHLTYFLRSKEAILDFQLPDDHLLLSVKGLDIAHTSVLT